MLKYYSAIILLSVMALGVLCILVHENGRIKKERKQLYYLTYLLIALSALSEWAGIQLDGVEGLPKWPLLLAKCADYILTPIAGGALSLQMKRQSIWHRILDGLLAANTLFQLPACILGWTVQVDAHNHYSHGPLYIVYVLVYVAVIMLVAVQFFLYGKTFRRQNRMSLYASLALVICGIALQEAVGSECRTAYISLVLAVALMFIHDGEFSQMRADDHIQEQWIQISTDPLTGLLSRYAYGEALRRYAADGELPGRLAVFSIDVNGLKTVNDT